jgi:hypothetical protein
MIVAHHEEQEVASGELVFCNQVRQEQRSVGVLGLRDGIVTLHDKVARKGPASSLADGGDVLDGLNP